MRLVARDALKFGILVGLFAIFADAVLAHGLFWENDPYWTYWVTKTFLLITIFSLGTVFLGIGLWQGLVITLVHTVVLEIYYDVFAPVGLPQEPMWLPFRDLWTVGFITHYLVILAGYFIALWVWRRHRVAGVVDVDARRVALLSLVTAVILLILDGLITHGLFLQSFPGWTYFVQRLLITFVFVFVWSAYMGYDWKGIVGGAVLLSLLWTGYSMYLEPMGLPTRPPRFLNYNALWFRLFPGSLISALLGLWIARLIPMRWFGEARPPAQQGPRRGGRRR